MKNDKRYYVYILASISGVLYIGVTGFLMSRVLQHKAADAQASRGNIARTVWSTSRHSNT